VRRQIDGCVDGQTYFAEVPQGGTAVVEIGLKSNLTSQKRLSAELPKLTVQDFALPANEKEIVAVIKPAEEPTEHLLNELLESATEIEELGIKVRLIVEKPADAENEKLYTVLKQVKGTALFTNPDPKALRRWRELLHAGDLRLPFAAAVDASGRGLFAFVNYHVGSVRSLIDIIQAE